MTAERAERMLTIYRDDSTSQVAYDRVKTCRLGPVMPPHQGLTALTDDDLEHVRNSTILENSCCRSVPDHPRIGTSGIAVERGTMRPMVQCQMCAEAPRPVHPHA